MPAAMLEPARLALVASTAILALAATPARAGIASTQPFGYTTNYGGSFVAGSVQTGDIVLTPASLTSTVNGDISYLLPRQSSSAGRWRSHSFALFTIGLIPIEITGLDFSMNYKLVLGGGDIFTPRASCLTDFSIRQAIDPMNPDPLTDPALFGNGFARYQEGNGYNVIDETFSSFPNFSVLGAGLTYYLSIEVDVGVSSPAAYTGPFQISTTLEHGGPASVGNYDGFAFTMNYREVPAPGPAGLLGIVAVAASRRRR